MTVIEAQSRPGVSEPLYYDPFDYRVQANPYPVYRRMREEAPLYYHEGLNAWFVSRYDDVLNVARDVRACSNKDQAQLETIKEAQPHMQAKDPPDHGRLRGLVIQMFTPKALAHLETMVRELVVGYLEPFEKVGKIDLINDFSGRFPMSVICRMIGFPAEREAWLRQTTDRVLHREDGVAEMPEGGAEATRQLVTYFEEVMAERARTGHKEDLVSFYMRAEAEGKVSHEEVIGALFQLSIAGNETTTKLVGNMAWQLHTHPDQKEILLRDPSLIASAVEETMRYDGPTHLLARTLVAEKTMHGITMQPGQKIGMLFISANRDERRFPDAERYDVRRNPVGHLGFGGGLHACLGAALARMETRVAFQEMLKRIPDFAVDESQPIPRVNSPAVRGFSALPIKFTPNR